MSNKEVKQIKRSLYNKCIGYDYGIEKVFKLKTQKLSGDGKTIITSEETKVVKLIKRKEPTISNLKKYLSKRGWE